MRKNLLLVILTLFVALGANAQVIYSNISPFGTATGGSASTYCGVTFGVTNNNSVPIAITEVGHTCYPISNATSQTYDLWVTADPGNVTSTPNVTIGAAWSPVALGVTVPGSAPAAFPNGRPIFAGLGYVIQPGQTVRFCVGWVYGGNLFVMSGTNSGQTVITTNLVDLLIGNNGRSNGLMGYGNAPPGLSMSSVYTNYVGFINWKFTGRPCTDTPKALVDAPSPVCPNRGFDISVNPGYLDASYTWEYSDNGVTWKPWVASTPGLLGQIRDSITAPRWYRCLIKCINSGFSYLTPARKVDVAPFYYCYCINSIATGNADKTDIGNVSVYRLPEDYKYFTNGLSTPPYNNNTANKQYTSHQFTTEPIVMYRDSSFKIEVAAISANPPNLVPANLNAVVFIDFNRNGIFDANEKVMKKVINGSSFVPLTESATFTVPRTAEIGFTGMRVIVSSGNPDSCGTIVGEGEVEDYVVDMRYEPCKGPVDAGIAENEDSALCSDYGFMLTDTTYEKKYSEITRSWEISGDNIVWSRIEDSKNMDQIAFVFKGQPLYYRMRAICDRTKDTTYSTVASVRARDGNKCYCYSQAIGGSFYDSSDIGGISIGDYVMNLGGPHTLNPLATKKRTDHTDEAPLPFYIDSLYRMVLYHTQRNQIHGDAKVTVFMDFNNNKRYDLPYERVFTNYSTISNFTLDDTFTVPPIVITGVPTGMRLILNNNISPNDPSDEGCGAYISGETHDYMVTFHYKPFAASVGTIEGMDNFALFPNPTTGKFHIQFNSRNAMNEVDIVVTNVTGQKVLQQRYDHKGGEFSADMDMTKQARGVYFVELISNGQRAKQKIVVQ